MPKYCSELPRADGVGKRSPMGNGVGKRSLTSHELVWMYARAKISLIRDLRIGLDGT